MQIDHDELYGIPKDRSHCLNLEPEFRVVNQGIKWSVKSTEYPADKTSTFK
jgi:hypothetical protein